MLGFLNRFDAFSQPYTINLGGSEEFSTRLGGCISIILYIAIFSFIYIRTRYMHTREEPTMFQVE